MAKQKETLEMYLSEEQIEYIKSLPEEEREKAAEELLGIRRFDNGAVDLTTIPGKKGDFFRKKQLLLSPETMKDEEGLSIRRLGKDNYFTATCPFCGTTAEHEGKKYRYSKKTQGLLLRDGIVLFLVAALIVTRILHWAIGLIAITVATMDFTRHSARKMYYTLICRKCRAHFPMDEGELEKLKADLAAGAQGGEETVPAGGQDAPGMYAEEAAASGEASEQ